MRIEKCIEAQKTRPTTFFNASIDSLVLKLIFSVLASLENIHSSRIVSSSVK